MKIVNLMEDTQGVADCHYEHGLSFYVETPRHKLLLDAGASDKVLENAKILGIDLTQVDTLVLSHGHYDHSGGILAIAETNPQMNIYMQRSAGLDYYHGERYIGIDKEILKFPCLMLLDGDCQIDEELSVFTHIKGRRLWPKGNLALQRKDKAGPVQDDFEHEQCLVITAEGKRILLSGCAHNGILNILDQYRMLYQGEPDVVISGFHMVQKAEYSKEDVQNIRETAKELQNMHTRFYTGHCTGLLAFDIMKEVMGEQLQYVHCGDRITV
ncbi:MAG: MBL fold metallo-hydrolase [Lachnospiraceae bacterium]|nr:MBL fold metallo-hydrolase [Lachnospiraceae bacterium]